MGEGGTSWYGTLAPSAFAHDRGDLILVNLQIDLVEDSLVAKALGNISKFDEWSIHGCPLHEKRSDHIICDEYHDTGQDDRRSGGETDALGSVAVRPHMGKITLEAADR